MIALRPIDDNRAVYTPCVGWFKAENLRFALGIKIAIYHFLWLKTRNAHS